MKVKKETPESVTLFPWLNQDDPEEFERDAFYIIAFPGQVKVKGVKRLSVSQARDIAEAINKAADVAEGLAGRETA